MANNLWLDSQKTNKSQHSRHARFSGSAIGQLVEGGVFQKIAESASDCLYKVVVIS